MSTTLSIIIVTYNHQEYISRCLSSINRHRHGLSIEVIVIDNSSTDNTVTAAKPFLHKLNLTLIVNQKNLGFARATNQGIKESSGRYILILNPDTRLTKNCLLELVEYANLNTNVKCLIPRLLNPDGTIQLSVRNFPTLATFILRRTPIRYISHKLIKQLNNFHFFELDNRGVTAIPWALGASIFVRKAIFKKVGLFDQNFFLYCEDIDWFYRLKKLGIKAYYFPKSKIIHYHLAISDQKLISIASLRHLRSMYRYFCKHPLAILTGK